MVAQIINIIKRSSRDDYKIELSMPIESKEWALKLFECIDQFVSISIMQKDEVAEVKEAFQDVRTLDTPSDMTRKKLIQSIHCCFAELEEKKKWEKGAAKGLWKTKYDVEHISELPNNILKTAIDVMNGKEDPKELEYLFKN